MRWRARLNLALREIQFVFMTGSILVLKGMLCSCPREHVFTNCSAPPCSMEVDMVYQTNVVNLSNTTAMQGFNCAKGIIENENSTCVNDYCGGCFARYFAPDGAEIFCNSKIVTLCEWDKPFNLTCSYVNWKIKILYAVMRNAHQVMKKRLQQQQLQKLQSAATVDLHELYNSSLAHDSTQRSCSHSVLYEVSKRCDGKTFCKLSVLDIRNSFDPCPETRKAIVQLDYECYSDAPTSNASQVRFFTMGLLLIGSLFPMSILVLLITVQIKKNYLRDSYDMNNVHLPLTDNENPDF